jgi:hypothetical protein
MSERPPDLKIRTKAFALRVIRIATINKRSEGEFWPLALDHGLNRLLGRLA